MRAIFNGFQDCEQIKNTGFTETQNYGLTVGKEYRILGVSGWSDIDTFILVDDYKRIGTIPTIFFDVTDNQIPSDWIRTTYRGKYDPTFLLGPEIFAKDLDAYNNLFDGDRESTDAIWAYIESLET